MENQFKIKKFTLITMIAIIIVAIILSLKPDKIPVITPPLEEAPIINEVQKPDEKLLLETYIRENIGTIATDKPVLGGSWYVVSVDINSETKTGSVVYEDGHIQSKGTFIYTYQNNPQNITVTNFEILE